MPVSPLGDQDPANLIADKLDQDGDQVDEKFITAETAEYLLGRPLAELIAEGRANTPFTLRQVLERNPDLECDPRLVATVKASVGPIELSDETVRTLIANSIKVF